MSGYDEVLYVMVAMLLVSTMVLNANRSIQTNNEVLIEAQLEEQVAAYAQDILEEARALPFDAATQSGAGGNANVPISIPDGFTAVGPGGGENSRDDFNDFDDYDGYTETVYLQGTRFDFSIDVAYVETSDYQTYTTLSGSSRSTLKRMSVNVTSPFLLDGSGNKRTYTFSFIRSYYAD